MSVKQTVSGKGAGKRVNDAPKNYSKNFPAVHAAKKQNFGYPHVAVSKSFKSVLSK